MCLNTGTPKNFNFSFETNGKLMALGVPILKHFRVATVAMLVSASAYEFGKSSLCGGQGAVR